MPASGFIPHHIAELTGISLRNGVMHSDGQEVDSKPIMEALLDFIDFLPKESLLVAHNCHAFDMRILLLHVKEVLKSYNPLTEKVTGFLDTLKMARGLYPEQEGGHTQEALVKNLLSQTYSAHNALADVRALHQLFNHMKNAAPSSSPYTVATDTAVSMIEQKLTMRKNYETLTELVAEKMLSKKMAEDVASSGLSLEHLKIASKRGGIHQLFTEVKSDGKPRVTKSKPIAKRVETYLLDKFK